MTDMVYDMLYRNNRQALRITGNSNGVPPCIDEVVGRSSTTGYYYMTNGNPLHKSTYSGVKSPLHKRIDSKIRRHTRLYKGGNTTTALIIYAVREAKKNKKDLSPVPKSENAKKYLR